MKQPRTARALLAREKRPGDEVVLEAEFRIPKPRIPDSTSKNSPHSGIRIAMQERVVSKIHTSTLNLPANSSSGGGGGEKRE